ncbi:uncharacterized protein LOC129794348 [Lutzomyia longipalpis]|uniref:uncharacterized protein LOC129794348 n=1 Tax=Lutzomyia longipalpis TaxID=7200 RepID=UPI002483B4B4|nr:uncharacterized protein LOC129794348 [Lutzomyia longipalpis]XP_055691125.1 uncharacterized protein LOC129794348 [Lutzomyia longipalpis]
MGFIMLQKCCCFPLKKGTLIIGWYNVITSILMIIYSVVALCKQDTIIKNIEDYVQQPNFDEEILNTGVEVLMSIIIASAAIGLIVSALLIVGAKRGVPGLLLPWIILTAISLVLGLGYSVRLIILTFDVDTETASLQFFIFVVSYGIHYYLWLVVYSFFKMLRKEIKGEPHTFIADIIDPNDGLPAYSRLA